MAFGNMNIGGDFIPTDLSSVSTPPLDTDEYVTADTGSSAYKRRPLSALWKYIKGKIDNDTDMIALKNNISTLSKNINSPWKCYHTQMTISSGSTTKTGLSLYPIDCGLVIVAARGTPSGISSGGVAVFYMGYFFSKISSSYHNTFSNISIDGHCDNFSLTLTGETGTYNVSIISLNWNYNTGSF